VNQARVERLEPQQDSVRIWSPAGEIEARCLINSAGLYADEVTAMIGNKSCRIYPARREYCEVVRSKSHLVNGLVYPLLHADHPGLDAHFTKTVWGTLLRGPMPVIFRTKKTTNGTKRKPSYLICPFAFR
jgi:L-2-hydroxyglutarate oxidase LhgO